MAAGVFVMTRQFLESHCSGLDWSLSPSHLHAIPISGGITNMLRILKLFEDMFWCGFIFIHCAGHSEVTHALQSWEIFLNYLVHR